MSEASGSESLHGPFGYDEYKDFDEGLIVPFLTIGH
jgi:hypothetical protein